MALARWQATIVDEAGNVMPDVNIEVRIEQAGQPLLQLYSDRDGAVSIGNPFQADGDGFAAFHASGGAYRIRAYAAGFERIWRYVAIGTAAEFDFSGSEPPTVQNVDAGYALLFETETAAPPSAGAIRFDNVDLSAATEAYVSIVNLAGSEILDRLLELFDAGRSVKDGIILQNPATSKQASFVVNGVTYDDGEGEGEGEAADYVTLAIGGHNGDTEFPDNERVNFQRDRAGADGADGDDGDVPGGRQVIAGTGLTGGGDLTADRTLNVDKASAANVNGKVADKVITADRMFNPLVPVALSIDGEGDVDIDLAAGRKFTLAYDGSFSIAAPINCVVGDDFLLHLTEDASEAAVPAFAAAFLGSDDTDPADYINNGAGERTRLYCEVAAIDDGEGESPSVATEILVTPAGGLWGNGS